MPPGTESALSICYPSGLCCRTVLMALRETRIFTTARAATSVAAETARVPHGPAAVVRRRRSLTNGDSRDKACIHGRLACAFVRLRRPKAPLLISALDARTPRSARQRARPLRGGGVSIRANARASGGQGYFQHYSTTERPSEGCFHVVSSCTPRLSPKSFPRPLDCICGFLRRIVSCACRYARLAAHQSAPDHN